MSNIVTVIGATGSIGGALAAKLLSTGTQVRAVGRSNDKLATVGRQGAEIRAGSLDDVGFVTDGLRGVDAACTPSMGMNLWGGSPLSEDSTLTMLLTPITTSRRQGRCCEVLSKGSLSAKRQADEQTTAWMPEVEQCRSNCRNRIED